VVKNKIIFAILIDCLQNFPCFGCTIYTTNTLRIQMKSQYIVNK